MWSFCKSGMCKNPSAWNRNIYIYRTVKVESNFPRNLSVELEEQLQTPETAAAAASAPVLSWQWLSVWQLHEMCVSCSAWAYRLFPSPPCWRRAPGHLSGDTTHGVKLFMNIDETAAVTLCGFFFYFTDTTALWTSYWVVHSDTRVDLLITRQ